MAEFRKKFISLDLETTHLDMREGKIMEVGAVEVEIFYDEKEKLVKAKFGKRFTSLVNPQIPVPDTALLLTGIDTEELDKAPLWRDIREDFRQFVGDALLVGHNLGFDLQYLANQGLIFKNVFIDTLEFAQTLSPLAESHSLEYLAGEYDLKLEGSHRALFDSQSAGLLLAEVLNEYLRFPQGLQEKIRELVDKSSLFFREILLSLPKISIPHRYPRKEVSASKSGSLPVLLWESDTILQLPVSFSQEQELFEYLTKSSDSLLTAASWQMVSEYAKETLFIPSSERALCTERFQRLVNLGISTNAAIKVFIKILIFRHLKPGSLDLGQPKWTWEERMILRTCLVDSYTCGKHKCEYLALLNFAGSETRFMDLSGAFDLAEHWKINFSNRRLLLFDLARVEDEFTNSLVSTWNLDTVRQRIGFVFPLEKDIPSVLSMLPHEAEDLANELDLFFGICHLVYMKRENEFAENLMIDETEARDESFTKLFHPAEKLSDKVKFFLGYMESQIFSDDASALEIEALKIYLENFARFLQEFFEGRKEEKLYWLKFDANAVSLNSVPRNVEKEFRKFRNKFASVSIADRVLPEISMSYFQKRLGIEKFKIRTSAKPSALARIPVKIFKKAPPPALLEKLIFSLPGATLVVAPNETKLREIYEGMQKRKTPGQEVLAYRYSGGLGSLRAKFGASQTSQKFLLLTTNTLFRFFVNLPKLKNLVVLRLPFEVLSSKPSIMGLPADLSFVSHVLPRGVHALHLMLARFLASGEKNQEIYLLDPRILADYGGAFMQFLESVPDFDLEQVLEAPEF